MSDERVPTIHDACIVCGAPHPQPMSRYARAHLARCLTCGVVFAQRRPSDEELADHYGGYGTAWHDSPITRSRYRELLDGFESYRKLNRILDMGCGAGFFLEEARLRGWESLGTEFGDYALELNRAKGIQVTRAPISIASFPPASFDVVTAFEVVEHLRDPRAESELLRHLLRPGGLFYCTTPNFNSATRRILGNRWVVIEYPEHLCYFTRSSLTGWLARSGFVPSRVISEGISPSALRPGASDHTTRDEGVASDQRLRATLERRTALRSAKGLVNRVLNATGSGDTLKGWYELVRPSPKR